MSIHDISAECMEAARQWMPRELRYPLEVATTVAATAGDSFPATILNLSNKGCRVYTQLALRPGEQLKLVVEPLGLVEAEVRWTIGEEAGLAFVSRDPFHSSYVFSCAP